MSDENNPDNYREGVKIIDPDNYRDYFYKIHKIKVAGADPPSTRG